MNERSGEAIGPVLPASQAGRTARAYIGLSIGAAIATMGLKLVAYFLTGSVGLFSDAVESVINLIAALIAFGALTVAARPPDVAHAYGYSKAEYFSSGLEGALILVAGGAIAVTAAGRLFQPQPLENVGLGLAVSVVAAAINGGVALVLLRAGRRLRSITLQADGQHLLTDVWTSGGVLVGVLLVQLTGWLVLDPVVALLVAVNIGWTAWRLLRATSLGLLDTALPPGDQEVIAAVLAPYEAEGIRFHALRTRLAGPRRFMSLHILVPGEWTVQQGHNLCEQIEGELLARLVPITVFTHLEPAEDPAALADQFLDRVPPAIHPD